MLFNYLESHNIAWEPVLLTTISVIIAFTFLLSSNLIPIIDYPNIYVPQALDYFRVFLIASISSIFINYSFKVISRYAIYAKVIVEYLALLLLAFPQKSEIDVGNKDWNLTKREGYLFGLCYQLVNLVFYLMDIWEVFDKANISASGLIENDDYDEFHEYVSKRSTLANCIEVRKKTKSLKKNVYSNVNSVTSIGKLDLESQPFQISPFNESDPLLLSSTQSHASTPYLSLEPSITPPPVFRLKGEPSTEASGAQIDKSPLYTFALTLSRKPTSDFFLFYQCLALLLTTMMECGTSLLLSLAFIYVPNLDDSLFSSIEKYFHDRMFLFALEVVTTLWLAAGAVWWWLGVTEWSKRGSETGFEKVGVVAAVSGVLFVTALNYT